ncbi:membrane protein [Actinoplanes ianthinogenes]|uniref:Membrane protein n=1 Tax=Actinoplanes ianthinogenes TaxID=122358 RepID=A0ABM7LK96_9ACTN|nr:AEC family transporter [Actinoplanes ianthinogenes]BCJ39672.1 membrane protein [Actinoplanes ianthinogenes]GGR48208.1 membrane protein [Actinoplanes ianthinogenes]
MVAALSGFLLIGVIVAAGWGLRRWSDLPPNAETVLARVVWLVLNPCLLFTGVAAADLTALFSEPLLISAAAALLCFALHPVVSRKTDKGTRIVGSLASGYVNANYIGIPVATYILGDPALVVPIIMVQLLIITPIALTLLELAATGRAVLRDTLIAPVKNPMIIAVLLGATVSLTGLHLPRLILDPLITIGHAAVPLVLIAFGMSLSGRRVLAPGPDRAATVAAVVLKTAAMPLLAFLLATAFRLEPQETYAVTVLACLPTAQNVYLYGQRFTAGLVVARDTIFLTTLACAPVVLLATLLFTLR